MKSLNSLLCLAGCLFLTACGSPASEPEPENSPEAAETPAAQTSETPEPTPIPQPSEPAEDKSTQHIFVSELLDFSFLYTANNKAFITDTGAAVLAVNGDETLKGLFVSAMSKEDCPEMDQMLEEMRFNDEETYKFSMIDPPAGHEITAQEHKLTGYIFSYCGRDGRTVDQTCYIEERDAHYIFYRTEIYRDDADYWAPQDALELAMRSLEFSKDAYGPADAPITPLDGEAGNALDQVRALDPGTIKTIRFLINNGGDITEFGISDREEIAAVYEGIYALTILEPTGITVDDLGLSITVETEEKTIDLDFEDDIIVFSDGNRFTVRGMKALNQIIKSLS